MKIIAVPANLEERSFDRLVQGMEEAKSDRLLFDARHLRWVDPYGMLGLLAAGTIAGRSGTRPLLQLPESSDVASYLTRMGFFEHAGEIFELQGSGGRGRGEGASDVLLEITAIRSHGDIHVLLDRIQERMAILMRQLHYPIVSAMNFSVILSEVCQNIMEHAQAPGWVASQTYFWKRRLGRKAAVIAVMDLGIGFRGSLAATHAGRYGDRWSDVTALEAAFIHGMTRFHDPGRGQGIKQIRRQVGRMGGRVSIRSGTARIGDVPEWDDAPPLEEHLAPFPGSQIGIVLPARVAEDADTGPDAASQAVGGASGRSRVGEG
jgi:hypothetical protein